MSNFDDIFAAPSQAEHTAQPGGDGREAWIAARKQELEAVNTLADTTTQRIAVNGELFQTYLDIQSRIGRYSVKNAILLTAQCPGATRLATFADWQRDGVSINKGEKGISILVPKGQYSRGDGSKGTRYGVSKVFDISQTSAMSVERPAAYDDRKLLSAMVRSSPCPIEIRNDMNGNIAARYHPDDRKIYVRQGLDAGIIFRSVTQEMGIAAYAKKGQQRSECEFEAYCISYMLCRRFGVSAADYRFERLPAGLGDLSVKAFHSKLYGIRDTANGISNTLQQILEPRQKNRDSSAR